MEKIALHVLEPTNTAQQAAELLLTALNKTNALTAKKTLLFLSGGSCIEVITALLSQLPADASLSHLTVSLADERWVTSGSPDSNEQQLRAKGVIQALQEKGATYISMLSASSDPEEAANILSENYQHLLSENEEVVLLAGVGADGHSLGILPDPDASVFFQRFSQQSLVCYYQLSKDQVNPHPKRITLTLTAVSKMTQIFVYATGESKREALQHLLHKDSTVNLVPALGLYLSEAVPQVYTDQQL